MSHDQPMDAPAAAAPLLDDDDPALFPKLTDAQIALLSRHGKVRPMAPGDVLFQDGDDAFDAMAVLDGVVAVSIGSGPAARTLALQRARDLMVELSIFTGQRVGATGVALEGGSLLVVEAEAFRTLVGRELEFGDFILQTMLRRRRALERLTLGIRIVGSRFDRDAQRLREFAARNRVLHEWVDTDAPRSAARPAEPAVDVGQGPVVSIGGGRLLHNPTNAELADAIGLIEGRFPADKTYDLVVVGAGPGGLAACVYGASGGLRTAALEAVAVGGQAATSARIENYLGFPTGLSGADLAERARQQAAKFDAHVMAPRRAVGLTERGGFHVITTDDGDEVLARSVILALGVQYRRLPIPGLADYEGVGVVYAADLARQHLNAGDDVVVVGGANSAGQAALSFAEAGRRARLVVRAEGLERSMARYLRERIAREPLVEVLVAHEVRELAGDGRLERVVVEDARSGARRTLAAGALVILIGAEPPTEWLAAELALDEARYILTGPALGPDLSGRPPWDRLGRAPFLLESSRPGVFAVGDVRSGSTKMVAPAAGEGGMAVRFAAEHLARTG
jgi:thioredoxin reductase (NADPH)